MWRIECIRPDEQTLHWSGVMNDSGNLSFDRVRSGWQSDRNFRSFWIASLRTLPFVAYCWECPPVWDANVDRAFECVFVSSPSLGRIPADRVDFVEHFRPDCEVVTFRNLGGDALLVAPCPEDGRANFSHLASFTATASPGRQDELWRAVGEALALRMGPSPLWLSTAGHGVAWLHVRLDSSPKYYRHLEYTRA